MTCCIHSFLIMPRSGRLRIPSKYLVNFNVCFHCGVTFSSSGINSGQRAEDRCHKSEVRCQKQEGSMFGVESSGFRVQSSRLKVEKSTLSTGISQVSYEAVYQVRHRKGSCRQVIKGFGINVPQIQCIVCLALNFRG